MSNKLDITNEMLQFDKKNRNFMDELTEEEQKKFSPFLMIRWGSDVQGSADLQGYYLMATNERLNKHFFAVNRHPQLQWLMATSVSPGLGTHRHQWIAPKKKEAGLSAKRKALVAMYPDYKDDEIELLAAITTKKELDAYIKQHGREK